MLLHWSDPPTPISSFSKQIWVVPLLNPSKVFGDPAFCLAQNQVIPVQTSTRPPPPPPQVINDLSLTSRYGVSIRLNFVSSLSQHFSFYMPLYLTFIQVSTFRASLTARRELDFLKKGPLLKTNDLRVWSSIYCKKKPLVWFGVMLGCVVNTIKSQFNWSCLNKWAICSLLVDFIWMATLRACLHGGRWGNQLRWGKKDNPSLHAILRPRHPGVYSLKIIEWLLST